MQNYVRVRMTVAIVLSLHREPLVSAFSPYRFHVRPNRWSVTTPCCPEQAQSLDHVWQSLKPGKRPPVSNYLTSIINESSLRCSPKPVASPASENTSTQLSRRLMSEPEIVVLMQYQLCFVDFISENTIHL